MAIVLFPMIRSAKKLKKAHKNAQKRSKTFKPRVQNFDNLTAKMWLSLYFTGCIGLAWYCGKMYRRHLHHLLKEDVRGQWPP